jgi:hypothetical protein
MFYPDYDQVRFDSDGVRTKVCGPCPIRQQCLDYAISNREEYGIWGGTLPGERRKIIRIETGNPDWRWPRPFDEIAAVKEFCPRGHPLRGDNVSAYSDEGYRRCLQCRREYKKQRKKVANG